MKKVLLVVLVSATVFSANAMDDNQVITLISLDKEKFQVEVGVAKQSVTLKNLMEDADVTVPLDLPNIRGATLATILELLRVIKTEANPQEAQTYIQAKLSSLSEAALIEFIAAVNFLDIPHLLQASVAVAQKIDLRKMPHEQLLALPKDLRNSILLGQAERLLGNIQINQLATLQVDTCFNIVACVTPDGSKIVACSLSGVYIWDLASRRELAVIQDDPGRGITSVCITPDGSQIVYGYESGAIRIRVLNNLKKEPLVLEGLPHIVYSVCVTPDGSKIVSGSADGISIWDLNDHKNKPVLLKATGTVNSVCVAPDGRKVVSGSTDGTIRVWDLSNYQELAVLKGHRGTVYSVSITPDGSKIVSGGADGTIRVWDLSNYQELAVLKVDTRKVYSVCVTPDGSKIVSGDADGAIRVWDLNNHKNLAACYTKRIFGSIHSVAVTPDGNKIISGSDRQVIEIWDISIYNLMKNMSREQAQQVLQYLQGNHAAGWDGLKQIFGLSTGHAITEASGGEPVLKKHKAE